MTGVEDPEELRRSIEAHEWYHTIELAPGVSTPGWFDTSAAVDAVGLPDSLRGMRCLDIGTFDGFWAFEMERRGADGVDAIDLTDTREFDWPAGSSDEARSAFDRRKAEGSGFETAHEILGSKVRRHELNVYDLDPSLGRFDFVYLGSLLLHLRDPVRALERAASVCSGRILVVDAIDYTLTVVLRRQPVAGLDGVGRPWWWRPNTAGLRRMVEAAGLRVLDGPRRFFMPYGAGHAPPRPALRSMVTRAGLEAAVHHRWGDPHAAFLAEPG